MKKVVERVRGGYMKMMIIGSPGAGKSTFARKLAAKTGLPLFYLDMIFHRADRTTVPPEEFDRKLNEILRLPEWIIDGNYMRTLPLRLAHCDQVFFFDLPTDVCLQGAASRVGTKRDDLPWVEETFDADFKQYIMDFPQDQLPVIRRLMEEYKESRDIITFRTREAADAYIASWKGE